MGQRAGVFTARLWKLVCVQQPIEEPEGEVLSGWLTLNVKCRVSLSVESRCFSQAPLTLFGLKFKCFGDQFTQQQYSEPLKI